MKIQLFALTLFINLFSSAQLGLIWADEFDGESLDLTKWTFDLGAGGWGNGEPQYYTSNERNVGVDTGYLRITAIEETFGGADYTSARIKTQGLFDFKYGKVEARIKMPVGQGLWPAFWMLGTNITEVGWPLCGEIDIMEHVSNSLYTHGTYHYDNGGHVYFGDQTYCDVTQWHVYGVEWDEFSIKWFLDGVEFYSANITGGLGSKEEFHRPFFLILNMAVGGYWPGYPDGTTPFPSDMFIDYVRVYSASASIEDEQATDKSISLYPNPTNALLTFAGLDVNDSYRIMDLSGKLIDQGTIDSSNAIDVADLVNGLYLIEIRGESGVLRKRLRFVKSN